MPQNRLTPELIAVIALMAEPLGSVGSAVLAQARTARVARASTTMIDLEQPGAAPAIALPDGLLPTVACYETDGIPRSEVLAWIRGGDLVGVEQPWFTDERPVRWPTVDQVGIRAR